MHPASIRAAALVAALAAIPSPLAAQATAAAQSAERSAPGASAFDFTIANIILRGVLL